MCAVFLLQLANTTQQSLDGFMVQFNKNSHGVAPASQVRLLPLSTSSFMLSPWDKVALCQDACVDTAGCFSAQEAPSLCADYQELWYTKWLLSLWRLGVYFGGDSEHDDKCTLTCLPPTGGPGTPSGPRGDCRRIGAPDHQPRPYKPRCQPRHHPGNSPCSFNAVLTLKIT